MVLGANGVGKPSKCRFLYVSNKTRFFQTQFSVFSKHLILHVNTPFWS